MGPGGPRAVSDWLPGASHPWTDQNLRAPTHVLGATGFGLIAALGATAGLGVVFWILLALSAVALVTVARRALGGVMVAGLIGAVPVFGWMVTLYVAVTRSELFDEHRDAVAVALGLSLAPYLLASTFQGSPTVAFLAGAALWHVAGVHLYGLGHDAFAHARNIALGPGLVLLLVLPHLDLDLPEVDLALAPAPAAPPT
jgi:hypothetical protein